jgi:nitronate monooxygenase
VRHATEAMRRLSIEQPFIQGPFGGGLSSARLAAAVTRRGSLGAFGCQPLDAEGIVRVAAEIRALTSGPFALNLWVSGSDPGGVDFSDAEVARMQRLFAPYFHALGAEVPTPRSAREVGHLFANQISAVLEARPAVFSFVYGVPPADVLATCRKLDITTIGAATSVAEARALDDAGVDLIVATGLEAGGHRVAFLARPEDSLMGTFALVQLCAPRVRAPVIAAGGIVDAVGIRAARALGAQLAQLGTAFLACEESGATPEHRAALFSDAAFDTTLTRSFTGRLARGLSNRWTREMAAVAHAPYPLQSFFTGALRRAAQAQGGEARTELVSLWSSQVAPNLRHRTVDALIDALVIDG